MVLAEFGNTGATVVEVCAELGLPLFVCFRGHDATMHKRYASMERRYRRLFGQARGIVAESRFLAGELTAIGCPEALVERDPERRRPRAASRRASRSRAGSSRSGGSSR